MRTLHHLSWRLILFSLPVATVGWCLKLGGQALADEFIVVGTGLVVSFCTRALQQLLRQLSMPVLAPLALLGLGLGLLGFETLVHPLSAIQHLLLRLSGESVAVLGSAWLLLRLNMICDRNVTALPQLRRTR